jgi:hypothetical protein
LAKRWEDIERRIEDIEKDVAVLRARVLGIRTAVEAYPEESTSTSSAYGQERVPIRARPETPGVVHNRLGDPYSIKLVYPAFYQSLDVGIPYCTIGFPTSKERLARKVQKGTNFFIYITTPVRRVIGLARAMGPAEYRGDVDPMRPFVVTLEWMVGPKADGVSFADVGLEIRARTGDSVYAIPPEIGVEFVERLQGLCDLDQAEVESLRERYRF